MISAPCSRRPGINSRAVADTDLYIRFGGSELIVSSHSLSPSPMTPTFIPFEEVRMTVFFALPSDSLSPRAGSRTLASSQGKLHCEVK